MPEPESRPGESDEEAVDSGLGNGSRMVPGTIAMASSLASAWYRSRYCADS